MGKQARSYPRMTHHRARGLARVVLNGKTYYLGKWGSPEATQKYDRLIQKWVAAGRDVTRMEGALSITAMCRRYREHAKEYYRDNEGKPAKELAGMQDALKPLWQHFGTVAASDFGPLRLQELREHLIKKGMARTTINNRISRVRRVFRWAESQELIPRGSWESLRSVRGLAKGRSKAPDRNPVMPVEWSVVEATIPFVPIVVAAMIHVQHLCALRPGEVVRMKSGEISVGNEVWVWSPAAHKTAWRGRDKRVPIGPKAQRIIAPRLSADPDAMLFPTKVGDSYATTSYCRAIARGVKKASAALGHEVPHWSPNQLRHSRLTEVRAQFGLEAAQTVGGHAKADVTQVYAERDLQTAIKVAREIG